MSDGDEGDLSMTHSQTMLYKLECMYSCSPEM